MGNQRRFAAQASDPPQTASNCGRKVNGSTPSPFPPKRAGANFFPLYSHSVVRSAALPEAPPRSRLFLLEISYSDDPYALPGGARRFVPVLEGRCGSRARRFFRHSRQDCRLSTANSDQSKNTGPPAAPQASARAGDPIFGSCRARGNQLAEKALVETPFVVRIASATCMRPRGRIIPITILSTVHTEEEETNVAQRTGQWRPVQQRTVCRH